MTPRHGAACSRGMSGGRTRGGDVYLPVSVLFNQVAIAVVTAGLTLTSPSLPYLSTSPVFAGTSRWLIPGTFTTSTGPAFLRLRASASSLSAFSGGTCVSSAPWTMSSG